MLVGPYNQFWTKEDQASGDVSPMHMTFAGSADTSEACMDTHQLRKAKHSVSSDTQGP